MYSCIIGRSSFEGSVIKKLERVKKEIEQEKPEKDFGLFRLKFSMISTFNKNFPKRPYNLHILSLKYLYILYSVVTSLSTLRNWNF